ncbi:DUF7660 family protein [Streptomyces sp. YGL11-2]|uniref:DUF7660 family protein n=1 Tax=Streptomyces sp. YGL11-2 TaxID=3414028 RepID=UPI003CF233AB
MSNAKYARVSTPAEFVDFLRQVECQARELAAEGEGNQSAADFLAAAAQHLEGKIEMYKRIGQPLPATPTWQLLVDSLGVASVYPTSGG